MYFLGLNVFFFVKRIVFWQADFCSPLFNKYLLDAYCVPNILQGSKDIIINIVLDIMNVIVCCRRHRKGNYRILFTCEYIEPYRKVVNICNSHC